MNTASKKGTSGSSIELFLSLCKTSESIGACGKAQLDVFQKEGNLLLRNGGAAGSMQTEAEGAERKLDIIRSYGERKELPAL